MAVHLGQIVPWGRSCNEYCRMFNLAAQDLSGGVLDCGGGPASFTAELSALGHRAVSLDPIGVDYELQRGGNQMLRLFRD